MSSQLQQLFERLEESRAALWSQVEGLDESRLNQRPAADQWSVGQVLCHLITAEKASLDDVRKKMDDPSNLAKAGLGAFLKSALLTVILRSPLRFQAPARSVPAAEPQDLESTRRQWDEVRSGWQAVVDSFPAELADKAIFRHPVAGPLSLAQALRFMEEHVKRHTGQIAKTIAAVG